MSAAQAAQGSAAWVASIAFYASGGDNDAQYGAANVGSQPVVICEKLYAFNGTEVDSVCTTGAVPAQATTAGQGNDSAWWTQSENWLGWSGSVVVYSKDGATPITPFGWVDSDQHGNNVINGVYLLTWTPTSPPHPSKGTTTSCLI